MIHVTVTMQHAMHCDRDFQSQLIFIDKARIIKMLVKFTQML